MTSSERIHIHEQPTDTEVIGLYLHTLGEEELQTSQAIADELQQPNLPIADTVVIIPIAAAFESINIQNAIAQYARQENLTPFTLVLGLNIDTNHHSIDDVGTQDCIREIAKAKLLHPDLDIRTSFTRYCEPTIGRIRRDLWNGVLLAKYIQHDSPGNGIGINHDIDVIRIPKGYIAAVQRHYQDNHTTANPAYTMVRHGYDPAHPNTSKYTLWRDFWHRQLNQGYSAGCVIPFRFYARNNGIDPTKTISEIDPLVSSAALRKQLPTGYLITSLRRMVDRLPDHGANGIWTRDSFGSTDVCRIPSMLSTVRDMPAGCVVDLMALTARPVNLRQLNGQLFDAANDLRSRLGGSTLTTQQISMARESLSAVAIGRLKRQLRLTNHMIAACTPTTEISPDAEELLVQIDVQKLVDTAMLRVTEAR